MKDYTLGQKLIWFPNDFDGQSKIPCVVTSIHDDHVIARGDGMNLWIDDDTEPDFYEDTRLMTITTDYRDLFTVGPEYHLVHCISADFAMGAGIAVEFNRRFDMKNKLRKLYPNYESKHCNNSFKGDCILIENTLNLITKKNYWHKPTYQTLEEALIVCRDICVANNISKIAMPLIGCGLDKLIWDKVSTIIENVFGDTSIDILVCIK